MAYRIELIGKDFTARDVGELQDRLSSLQTGGWELSFVFPVVQRSCLFIREETYLMVLRRDDDPEAP